MSAPAIPLNSAERRLLEEAAEWRLLGLLFECPTAAWRDQVAAVSRGLADAGLRAAAELALGEASEGLYHSIFGPGGPAAAREASYQNSVQLGYLMAELAAFYEAFAYRPATQEALDHVSVEAGFVGYLRLKEAYALACSDAERAAVTEEAARRFLGDHLANMAEPLATALGGSGVGYLALAGEALLRRVGSPRKAPEQRQCNVFPSPGACAFDCGDPES